jgi:predicted MFS family arabinose efflux permease
VITQAINLYKNAFSGLTKKIWLLSIVMLVNRAGTMVLAFMTLYCHHIGYTIKQGGIVVAIYGIGSIVGAFLGGRISDKLGFYYTQFFALFFGGCLFILLGQMQSYNTICICTFFLSMVNESFRPANSSAIAYYSNLENRTQSYSLVRLSINLGWAIGSALGGILASINYHLLFWVDGFTNITAAIVLLLVLPKVSHAQQQKTVSKEDVIVKDKKAYQDKTFLYFLAFQILFASCFFQLFTTIPLYFKTDLKLSENIIGNIMAGTGVMIVFFEMVLVYILEKRKSHLKLMSYGSILMAISYFILNIPIHSVLLIAIFSMIVITVSEMISMPFMNSYYMARTTEKNRGQYAGMYTMAWSIAQVLGSYIGSALADGVGFYYFWFIVGGTSMLAAVGYYWLFLQKKSNEV